MIDGEKQMSEVAIIYLFLLFRDIINKLLNQIKPIVLSHQSKNKIERYSGEKLHSCQPLLH